MMIYLFYNFMVICVLINSLNGENKENKLLEIQGRNCTYSGIGTCPKEFICLRKLCTKRCFYKGHCPNGYICQNNFVCVKNACPISDNNCCPHCPEKCKKPGDCPIGWSCFLTKCRRIECHSKKDCENEWPCRMGKCFPKACMKDKDCPKKWKCSGKSHRCTKVLDNETKSKN